MAAVASYRPDIDGLRAIAVVAVVFYHAGVVGFSGGYVGVDIFFVISGFLISGIIIREVDKENFTYKRFYEHRVRRILPALLVMLVASSVLAYLLLVPGDIGAFGKELASVVVFSSNIHFWRTIGYFDPQATNSPLLHTWSLGIEEQFYVAFPFFMVWLLRHHRRATSKIITFAIVISFVLCFSWTEIRNPQTAFFLLPTRAWEFLLGTSIALHSWRLSANPLVRNIASAAAVGGLICSITLFNEWTQFPGFAAALPAISTTVFLDANRGKRSFPALVLSAPPIVALGLVSYSLYLWHWPIFAFTRYSQRPLAGWQVAGLLAASGASAALSWHFVERPARRVDKGGLSYGSVISQCVVASALLILFFIGDQFSRGFRNRYSPLALAYLDASMHRDTDTIRCGSVKSSLVLRGGLCRIGPPVVRTTDFLVWGDSHASALMPLFKVLAADRGVAGLIATKGSCSPVLGIERADQTSDCRQFNDSVFALIQRSDIHTVVMVAFWSPYTHGTNENSGFGQVRLRTLTKETLSAAESKAAFERALARTISMLGKLGVRTYIVADVPLYRGLIPLIANEATRGSDVSGLGTASAVYRAQRHELDSLFARFVDKNHVRVIDPGDVLCSGERCAIVADGRILYQDDHHLSVYGAMALKPLFARLFVVSPY